jgi:hypothetical protein
MTDSRTDNATLFGNPVSPGMQRKGQKLFRKYARKYGYDESAEYALSVMNNPILGPVCGVTNVVDNGEGEVIDFENSVIIGTIRMGYGHYRIAMALASAAHALGCTPCWFDLLAFDTPGARMIRDLDKWYSLGSRLSQRSKLFNRFIWDPMMGQWYKGLEKNYPIMQAARVLADIHKALPERVPYYGAHPFNSLGAVHAGLKNVVNVIPDNCPLGFHLADGAVQAVQSPSAYFGFRTLRGMAGDTAASIPADQLIHAGHYVDHEIVAHIEADCGRRLSRMRAQQPRRLLISIGGAGAQQDLNIAVVRHLMPRIQGKKVELSVNFGDHRDAWNCFCREIPDFERLAVKHFTWEDTRRCIGYMQKEHEHEVTGIHVFLHEDTFAAVYTTNMLMRVTDILITKPSELAFYPVPKLLLPRVGGHEAWGAVRAAEIGDGSCECMDRRAVMKTLDLMIETDDLLAIYCEQILAQHRIGVYSGAYRVIERGLAGRG